MDSIEIISNVWSNGGKLPYFYDIVLGVKENTHENFISCMEPVPSQLGKLI